MRSLSDVGPSPIEELEDEQVATRHIRLFIKRDDLVRPIIQGNKYRKLKYNLLSILQHPIDEIITCGGAYSNHLLAVSQAGKLLDVPTVGLVNALYADVNNPTLAACRSNGMAIRLFDKVQFKAAIARLNDDGTSSSSVFIPEGGSNKLALLGMRELYDELLVQIPSMTHLIVPCGSGGTFAGLFLSSSNAIKLIGVPILKMDMKIHIQNLYPEHNFSEAVFWQDAHLGGYAKFNSGLIEFIIDFYNQHQIVLDPIYNGKAMKAVYDRILNDCFPVDSVVVYVHTGGHQGIRGFNERFGLQLPQ